MALYKFIYLLIYLPTYCSPWKSPCSQQNLVNMICSVSNAAIPVPSQA